jgi:hypothetical protein
MCVYYNQRIVLNPFYKSLHDYHLHIPVNIFTVKWDQKYGIFDERFQSNTEVINVLLCAFQYPDESHTTSVILFFFYQKNNGVRSFTLKSIQFIRCTWLWHIVVAISYRRAKSISLRNRPWYALISVLCTFLCTAIMRNVMLSTKRVRRLQIINSAWRSPLKHTSFVHTLSYSSPYAGAVLDGAISVGLDFLLLIIVYILGHKIRVRHIERAGR